MRLEQQFGEGCLKVLAELLVVVLGVDRITVLTEQSVCNFGCDAFDLPLNSFVTPGNFFLVFYERA